VELSSGPAAQSRRHLWTVQTTAEGTSFFRKHEHSARRILIRGALEKNTYLLTYLLKVRKVGLATGHFADWFTVSVSHCEEMLLLLLLQNRMRSWSDILTDDVAMSVGVDLRPSRLLIGTYRLPVSGGSGRSCFAN